MLGVNKPPNGTLLDFSHPRTGGLVGYYVMNEGRGSRVNDISLNPAPGTATNFTMSPSSTSNWVGSYLGGCLAFDGSDDYVAIGTIPKLNLREFTLTAWINSTTVSVGTKQVISDSDSLGNNYLYGLEINRTAGRVSLLTSGAVLTGTRAISANTWYFIAGTRRGTDPNWTLSVYVNGALDITSTFSNALHAQQVAAIGRLGNGANHQFSGKIDEVRVYNRVLSLSEIQSLYTNPHSDFLNSFPKRFFKPNLQRTYASII